MALDPVAVVTWVGVAVGGGIAGFVGGKRGSREGASSTLNGTAETVRRIEGMVGAMGGKLDAHITETGRRFDALSADASDTRERVATIEGALTHLPPQPAVRKPPRTRR